jgi:hypothetical protein
MRDARNQAADKYPDHQELMTECFNNIIRLTPELLKLFEKIKNKIASIKRLFKE